MSGEGNAEKSGGGGSSGDGSSSDDGSSGGGSSGEWICAWCDKPHDRNDPPCDNCGHHKFERAVVPVAPENTDHEREPVWACPECGREHQRNSPPCSRCGNAQLEQRVPDERDYATELGGTSYLDLLEPRYAVALVVAVVAGAVLVLGLLGVISLPGMSGDSLAVSNVPGNATAAGGHSLAAVESEYVAVLNEQRPDDPRATRSSGLDDAARFYNQRRVKSVAGDGSLPSDDRMQEAIAGACDSEVTLYTATELSDASLSSFEDERAVAAALVTSLRERYGAGAFDIGGASVGVDVHALPGRGVSVTLLVC